MSENMIRRVRKRLSLTQADIAQRIGASLASVNRWENGYTLPTPYYQRKLCETLDCSIVQLFPNLTVELPPAEFSSPTVKNDVEPEANLVKQMRIRKGMSQEELAEAMEVTRVTVSRWERGDSAPRLYHRRKLCKVFKVNAAALFPSSQKEISRDMSPSISLPTPPQTEQPQRHTVSEVSFSGIGLSHLDWEQQRLELLQEAVALRKQDMQDTIETAMKVAEILYPAADEETRSNLVRTILADLSKQFVAHAPAADHRFTQRAAFSEALIDLLVNSRSQHQLFSPSSEFFTPKDLGEKILRLLTNEGHSTRVITKKSTT